jgi:ferredoxin-NADP reductase
MITEEFLKANIGDSSRNFYLCGPPPMMDAVKQQLAILGVGENSITLEL